MEEGDPADPIPYITINGQPLYAGEELYNKFVSYGKMGVHMGDYADGKPYRMVPDANNMVSCKIKVNNFRPYLGFGYGGKLSSQACEGLSSLGVEIDSSNLLDLDSDITNRFRFQYNPINIKKRSLFPGDLFLMLISDFFN